MGEAKRRKELGLPPREQSKELRLPKLDKESIQKKVRNMLYRNPIIPILFYTSAVVALIWGVYNLMKIYNFI